MQKCIKYFKYLIAILFLIVLLVLKLKKRYFVFKKLTVVVCT